MYHTYLVWLLVFLIFPLVFLWLVKSKTLGKYKLVLFLTLISSVFIAFSWDYIAISEKIWYFKKPYILGVWFLGLPIEEWLFIIFASLLFSSITILFWEKEGVKP